MQLQYNFFTVGISRSTGIAVCLNTSVDVLALGRGTAVPVPYDPCSYSTVRL